MRLYYYVSPLYLTAFTTILFLSVVGAECIMGYHINKGIHLAQQAEHCANNGKVVGSNPKKHTYIVTLPFTISCLE